MKDAGPFTRYTSHQAAEDTLAAIMALKEDDDPSSCKVKPLGRHFVIVFHDEDGVRIGPL